MNLKTSNYSLLVGSIPHDSTNGIPVFSTVSLRDQYGEPMNLVDSNGFRNRDLVNDTEFILRGSLEESKDGVLYIANMCITEDIKIKEGSYILNRLEDIAPDMYYLKDDDTKVYYKDILDSLGITSTDVIYNLNTQVYGERDICVIKFDQSKYNNYTRAYGPQMYDTLIRLFDIIDKNTFQRQY